MGCLQAHSFRQKHDITTGLYRHVCARCLRARLNVEKKTTTRDFCRKLEDIPRWTQGAVLRDTECSLIIMLSIQGEHLFLATIIKLFVTHCSGMHGSLTQLLCSVFTVTLVGILLRAIRVLQKLIPVSSLVNKTPQLVHHRSRSQSSNTHSTNTCTCLRSCLNPYRSDGNKHCIHV